MTAIAGLIDNGKVWMGGDSAGVGGYSLAVRRDSKVFCKDKFIFGFTSSFRMGQLLRYEFSPPTPEENRDPHEYMVCQFVPTVKDCLRAGGFMTTENGEDKGGQFLVGWRGRLFDIESDFQVGEVLTPFFTCGCGKDLALGSLHATERMPKRVPPKRRIELALQAAEAFSAGVAGPFCVKSV